MKLKRSVQKIQGQRKKPELMFWIGKVWRGPQWNLLYRGSLGEAEMSVEVWYKISDYFVSHCQNTLKFA